MPDDTLPANLAPSAFAGTAEDYARYRPPYPRALIDELVALIPGREVLLDLGCGPGRVALALAPMFDLVWAVDSEPEMIAVGQRIAGEQGVTNISWYCRRAEEFGVEDESLDLITIGEAFHRLDQGVIREFALRWLKPGGVLATMGCGPFLEGNQPWQRAVRELALEWTRDAFPAGWAEARSGSLTNPSELAAAFGQSGFVDVADRTYIQSHTWSLDEVAGYMHSMSICAPSILGARRQEFETSLRAALLAINPAGVFYENLEFGLTIARRPQRSSDQTT